MNFISPDYCKRVLADEFNFFLKIWKAYNGKSDPDMNEMLTFVNLLYRCNKCFIKMYTVCV